MSSGINREGGLQTTPGSDTVLVHTPDPTLYHDPEPEVAAKLGRRATMIPRADKNGGSLGVDPHRPGMINIVECGKDGIHNIAALDMSQVSPEQMDAALSAAGGDPQTTLELLSQQQGSPAIVKAGGQNRPTSRFRPPGGAYMVPPSDPMGRQLPEPSMSTGQPLPNVPLHPLAQQAQHPSAAALTALAPVAAGLDMAQVLQLLAAMQPQQPGPGLVAPYQPPQYQQPQAPQANPLADLRLEFLPSVPTRATQRVVFELGRMGSMSAKYHAVIQHGAVVALIYDTRFDGDQYLPPALDEPLQMSLPDGKSVSVWSHNLALPLGCMDIVLLLLADEQEQSEEIQQIKDMMVGGGPSG